MPSSSQSVGSKPIMPPASTTDPETKTIDTKSGNVGTGVLNGLVKNEKKGKENKKGANGSIRSSNSLFSPNRLEISEFVSRFQKILKEDWDSYQIAVSLFIVGKLSREELMEQIASVLSDKETRRMHNQLLMSMLSNCYREEPFDGILSTMFGNASKKRKMGNKSSQYENLKKDILSLSIRERVRLKGITKDSGKKGLISNVMILSRQAMVPRVPIITSQGNSNDISQQQQVQAQQNGGNASEINGSPKSVANNTKANQLEMTWISVNDILDMVNEPLSTESYELPERKRMRDIMLGLAREHGLLGGVSMKAVDVLYMGLRSHLKSVITNIIDNVRVKKGDDSHKKRAYEGDDDDDKMRSDKSGHSKATLRPVASARDIIAAATGVNDNKRRKITITTEDVLDSFTQTPHMIAPYGTIDFLVNEKLKNDDDYDLIYRELVNRGGLDMKNSGQTGIGGTEDVEKIITDENYNGLPNYVIPNKVTEISSLLKSKEKLEQERNSNIDGNVPKINLALRDKDIGTPDELNWVINDLLAEDA